jgi:potassium-dependent mechanosensitive channel
MSLLEFFSLRQLFRLFQAPLFHLGGGSVSIASIVILIVALVGVGFLSRLVYAVLRRRIFRKMGLDPGSSEAIASIASYTFGVIGFLMVLQSTGINLSSLTVLAGGLGLGLGFGLQELAKNFMSGLTLLFEQPIRIGDFVEIEGLTGTVQQISIRSTTIRTNDGVSVIVPNLNFITNKIINWTHQDPRSRLHIPVGVDIACDPIEVTELLLTAAHLESRVLNDPSPKVWLEQFGEGVLNFKLLVWIDNPIDKDTILSSLRFRIENVLRQHHIKTYYAEQTIAVKALDVHLPQLATLNKNAAQPGGAAPNLPAITPPPSLRKLLRKVVYFENFSDLELLDLIEQGFRQILPSKHVIFRENEAGNSFYIILAGTVDVVSEKADKHLATLEAGDFFGELSLLLGIPRSATVITQTDTVLFVVNQGGLRRLLRNHHELSEAIAQKLAERKQEWVQRRQLLRDLGQLDAVDEQNPLVWIRRRLQTLLEI